MRERLYQVTIGVLLLLLLTAAMVMTAPVSMADNAGKAAPTPTPATHHIQLNPGDEAWVLCAGCQFRITANGADSIYLEGGSFGAAE